MTLKASGARLLKKKLAKNAGNKLSSKTSEIFLGKLTETKILLQESQKSL